MKWTGRHAALIAATALGVGLFASAPAAAQATRTWVSGVGDDVNPCSRTAPCKTFAGAISKTAAGGEINCIDPAGFGAVTITKSISLICDNVENGILVSSANGINVNSTTAIVTLSGFDMEGFGNGGGSSTHGINIVNAAAVHIRNSKIRGFRNGYGINIAPNAGNTQVFIDNVVLSENGVTGTGTSGGIGINPAAGRTANVTITNTQIVNNQNVGVRVDTTGIVGSVITAAIERTTISNNSTGILVKAPNGTGIVSFLLNDSLVSLNSTYGIITNGTPATASARVGNTSITANGTGILILGTAQLFSYGDNRLNGNVTDGAFTSIVPKQ